MKNKSLIVLLFCFAITSFGQISENKTSLNPKVEKSNKYPSQNWTGAFITTNLLDTTSGCLNAPNGQWPGDVKTPLCNAFPYIVSSSSFTGEYTAINVTEGTEYIFSSSDSSHLITIGDSTGSNVLAAGIGSITWTSNVTGTVRFYTHLGEDCSYDSVSHFKFVQCGTPPTEPDYGCNQSYGDEQYSGSAVAKGLGYVAASDFFVPMESDEFKIETITLTLMPFSGSEDMSSFDINIMSNNNNAPGSIIHSFTGLTPVEIVELPETFLTFPVYEVTLDLENYELPVNASQDTKYWISLQVTSAANSYIFWLGSRYYEGWLTSSSYQSIDGGETYEQIVDENGTHYENIWSIDADCETLAVNDNTKSVVSFYPNPVKDELNIISKEKVSSISVYNAAGQKVLNNAQLKNGKVDMSQYARGTYIVTVIVESGKTETFKLIKK